VALRFSDVYGPYSYHKGSVVAAFCKQALTGRPLIIYGDGTQTRDFVFVEDLCRGIAAAVVEGGQGVVAHLGSGVETTVLDVAGKVAERFGATPFEHRPARVGDVPRSSADISTARQLFGFAPSTSLDDGLDRTVAWFRESDA
jgi:UDP-glucose 4-epimerase